MLCHAGIGSCRVRLAESLADQGPREERTGRLFVDVRYNRVSGQLVQVGVYARDRMKAGRDSPPETGRIPAAAELLPDIFVAVSERLFSQKSIVLAVAEVHCFQRGTLDTACPSGTNCTFRLKADAAVSYLHRCGFISRLGRKGRVSITQEGYDFLRDLTPEVIGSLSAEIEPKVKRLKGRAAPAPKNAVREPQSDSLPTLRSAKALEERIEQAKRLADGMPTPEERAGMRAMKIGARLPDMPLDKLHAIWTNAQEKLSHPKLEFRLTAKALLTAIEEERMKRDRARHPRCQAEGSSAGQALRQRRATAC